MSLVPSVLRTYKVGSVNVISWDNNTLLKVFLNFYFNIIHFSIELTDDWENIITYKNVDKTNTIR